ncbi:glycosyltransferase family 4 protein, partial [Capnocytophaga leadbetteri]|uniref:glycosyltransferase family 4 protein n=1 Tax=Capnocytophaga leadbetteri TaxID=327575 RepID=UPI0034E95F5F
KHFIQFLVAHNYEVYTMATDFTLETKKEVELLGAIPIDYTFARGGLNPFADLKNMKRLEYIFNKIQPDILFASFAKPVIFGTLAAKKARIPKIIAMLEGLGFSFTEQPNGQTLKAKIIKQIQVFLYKLSLPKADTVIFLNPDDPKDLLDKYHIRVKRNEVLGAIGLNLDEYKFSRPPINPISFIFVARLLREKGIFEYLQAVKRIKSQYPDVIFKVVGDLDTENPGSIKKEELEDYIQRKIIVYTGYVINVKEHLTQSSVFVLPSYREGVPRSTQEAMATGRAVITTNVPGCRETVESGKNGFLIPKWDIDALAEAMKYFIENPTEITRMGQESHQIAVQKFDSDKVNKKLFKIIDQ